jgi:hypothetical protein
MPTFIYEVKSKQADDPESDFTGHYTLEEMRERFPDLYPLVNISGFHSLHYTVDLHSLDVRIAYELPEGEEDTHDSHE